MQLPGPATTAAVPSASRTARALHPSAPRPVALASSMLEDIARGIAAGLVLDDDRALVEPAGVVAHHLVLATEAYDAWIMVWGPHASTDAHDHDGSVGVVHVVQGRLVETSSTIELADRSEVRVLRAGATSATGAVGTHVLANTGDSIVVGVSVYSPPIRGEEAAGDLTAS